MQPNIVGEEAVEKTQPAVIVSEHVLCVRDISQQKAFRQTISFLAGLPLKDLPDGTLISLECSMVIYKPSVPEREVVIRKRQTKKVKRGG